VPLEHPRRRSDPEFLSFYGKAEELFKEEVGRSADGHA
jgi:hypothetical protein